MRRRQFLNAAGKGAAAVILANQMVHGAVKKVPSYLKNYSAEYKKDPRKAAIKWFREAKFGMFIHYGLYSIPAGIWKGKTVPKIAEWIQYRAAIPVKEYAKLQDQFTASQFDADQITDLALSAKMKYINITTRHHDSFCLFNSRQTDFNSVNSPAKRDLIKELSESCQKKGLGFCLYYSHGRDWKHPHAPNNDRWGGAARPKYDPPESTYKTGTEHHLDQYLKFMKAQITELLTNYGPIANIWLDGIAVPKKPKKGTGADMKDFRCQELYDHIHSLQPQVLVSYKQGLLGTEDFFAPEHKAVENKDNKPMEICTTLQKGSWGWKKKARFIGIEKAMQKYKKARAIPANLLLNIGPKGDGSVPKEAVAILKEMGKRI